MDKNVRSATQNPNSKASEMLKYCSAFYLNSIDNTFQKKIQTLNNCSCADCINIYIKEGRESKIQRRQGPFKSQMILNLV